MGNASSAVFQFQGNGHKKLWRINVMKEARNFDPRLALNAIYNGIVAIDEEGIITYFNKTAERIFNLPAKVALDRYILDVLAHTGGKLLECLKTGKPFIGKNSRGGVGNSTSNFNPFGGEG